jgi:hypothetical protein
MRVGRVGWGGGGGEGEQPPGGDWGGGEIKFIF